MKKIFLACGTLILLAPASFAQTRQHAVKPAQQTTAEPRTNNNSSPATISHAPATGQNAGTQGAAPAIQTSSDIIVPDHPYQPAGTAGVGFFGDGTGGSTIGSTPANGGTGFTPPANSGQPAKEGAQQRSDTK